MNRLRHGIALTEMMGTIVGLALFATLIMAAVGASRQQRQVEAASARLEEAQNLLARWRSGGPVPSAGWTATVEPGPDGCEILLLRAPGLRLSTLRPRAGGAP